MKKMQENEVLHLGQTIANWRVIADCVRHCSKYELSGQKRAELNQIAASLEAHLPSNNPSTSQE
jgi:hypothetical protein